jgi:hypothetical protein
MLMQSLDMPLFDHSDFIYNHKGTSCIMMCTVTECSSQMSVGLPIYFFINGTYDTYQFFMHFRKLILFHTYVRPAKCYFSNYNHNLGLPAEPFDNIAAARIGSQHVCFVCHLEF